MTVRDSRQGDLPFEEGPNLGPATGSKAADGPRSAGTSEVARRGRQGLLREGDPRTVERAALSPLPRGKIGRLPESGPGRTGTGRRAGFAMNLRAALPRL